MSYHVELILFLFLTCQTRNEKAIPVNPVIETVQPVVTSSLPVNITQQEEFFVDSLHIGRKSLNKIEVKRFISNDSIFVLIKFYSKQKGLWKLRNKFQFEKDALTGCDTKLSDFNNDGLNDMTYISAVAARGANEVRRLFIYDKNTDKLIYMKNSEDYPNMHYNKGLKCIDAFLVYGGCSTVFLRINGDNLTEFASVELADGLTVTTYDKNGKEKIILRDTANKQFFIRYKNFNPLVEADEY
jgi:hypothetical protein